MNYYNTSGQMDLSDRIPIETGICIGESFKKIAKRLRRHPSTIAHEVKENRTLDELVTRLVKKGQPLTHIYAEHENEMPVCLRTLYNYIDEGALSIENIDLRRKTGYKQRKKKYNDINGFHSMEYRQCRTYEDFEYAMKFKYSEDEVTA